MASVKRFSMLPFVRCPDARIQVVIGASGPLHGNWCQKGCHSLSPWRGRRSEVPPSRGETGRCGWRVSSDYRGKKDPVVKSGLQ